LFFLFFLLYAGRVIGLEQMPKEAEFAPGIPHKTVRHPIPEVRRPDIWQFGVHDHKSEGGAGRHFDLRLGHPASGHAHSWAMRHWPEPGEARLAVQQPTHTIRYMDFQGRIESGYGKGQVDLARRDRMRVTSSSPDHVRFDLLGDKGGERESYLIHRTDGNKWLLHNITNKQEKKASAMRYRNKTSAAAYVAMQHELLELMKLAMISPEGARAYSSAIRKMTMPSERQALFNRTRQLVSSSKNVTQMGVPHVEQHVAHFKQHYPEVLEAMRRSPLGQHMDEGALVQNFMMSHRGGSIHDTARSLGLMGQPSHSDILRTARQAHLGGGTPVGAGAATGVAVRRPPPPAQGATIAPHRRMAA